VDSDTIKALKENKLPHEDLSPMMQAQFANLDPQDLETRPKCDWSKVTNSGYLPQDCTVHRLRPDYEEKPEIVERPVKKSDSGALCYYSEDFDICYGVINNSLSNPDFIGFKYEWTDGARISPVSRLYYKNGMFHEMQRISCLDDIQVLTPTHVLFQKATK
jgi:hypothetical protein